MNVDQLLQHINTQYRTSFHLLHQYDIGEWGAFLVQDVGSECYILKYSDDATLLQRINRAIHITERLRALGWPIPRYLRCGVTPPEITYSLQQHVSGSPRAPLTKPLITDIIALNELQHHQAVSDEQNWSAYINAVVYHDRSGWQKTIRSYSTETALLCQQLQALARDAQFVHLPSSDVVHSDFTTDNILVEENQITAVIDWDAAGCGDRFFDLAKLLFSEHENQAARELLFAYCLTHIESARLRLYIVYSIYGQLDWSIRHHTTDDIQRWLHTGQFFARYLSENV